MGGRYVPGGVESPCGTSVRRRTIGRGGHNDGRDFGGSGRGGRLISFAFAPTGSSIRRNSRIEFAGATMNDLSIRTGGKEDGWLGGGGVPGDCGEGGTRPVRPACGGVGGWWGDRRERCGAKYRGCHTT